MIAQSLKFVSQCYETHLMCFCGKSDTVDESKIKDLGLQNTVFIKIPGFLNFIKNVLILRRSFQECLYFSRKNQKIIDNYIALVKPDLIICDMIRTGQYISRNDIPYIVDLDDILSIRYKKMLLGNNNYSVLGTYAERLPRFINRIEMLFRCSILKYEIKKLKVAECNSYLKSNAIILTSEKEAEYLNKLLGSNKAIGIPQAVTCTPKYLANTKNILFIGNLTTAQNIASLEYIINILMPEVDLLISDYSLHFVGRYDERALRIINKHKKVILHGFVDDFQSLISICRMSIGHVSFGTGIKTKILDSLALGLPTVTNTVGAEGLKVENNLNIVISDDPKVQAEEIYKILTSDYYASKLASGAQRYISSYHSYDFLQKKYLDLIDSVMLKNENQ